MPLARAVTDAPETRKRNRTAVSRVLGAWAAAISIILVATVIWHYAVGGPVAVGYYALFCALVSVGPAILTWRWARTDSSSDSNTSRAANREKGR